MRLRRLCKDHCAEYRTLVTLTTRGKVRLTPPYGLDHTLYLSLGGKYRYGIIVLTECMEDGLGFPRLSGRQGCRPSAPPRPQSQAPDGARSGLYRGQSLLRCQRSHSGEVRDAPSGSRGGSAGESEQCGLRLLPPLLLRGPGCFQGVRLARLDAAAARTAAGAQALGPGAGHARSSTGRAAHPQQCCSGAAGPGALWRQGASPKYRARSAAPAKGGLERTT